MMEIWIKLGMVAIVCIFCVWALCDLQKKRRELAESMKKLNEALVDLDKKTKELCGVVDKLD